MSNMYHINKLNNIPEDMYNIGDSSIAPFPVIALIQVFLI